MAGGGVIQRLKTMAMRPFVRAVRQALLELGADQAIKDQTWTLANKRPGDESRNLIYLPGDIQKQLYTQATARSAQVLAERYPQAAPYLSEEALLRACVAKALAAGGRGLYLEFGVYQGRTINIIADAVAGAGLGVHGFDSFQGLPEDWNETARKGLFDLGGKLPPVRANVKLYPGWFDATLPAFLRAEGGPVAFLHIDSDLYSSARTVLTGLASRLGAGSVILFDEYWNYPTFEQHEFKAFDEFLAATGWTCECLGYDTAGFAVGFALVGRQAPR